MISELEITMNSRETTRELWWPLMFSEEVLILKESMLLSILICQLIKILTCTELVELVDLKQKVMLLVSSPKLKKKKPFQIFKKIYLLK